mgnify:CR=1 FL=1
MIVILAFVPMLFTAIGYSELNKADPDCGTTFTWATRAFGPKTGWLGGWGIIAADVLVMASLAQVAGQYLFLPVQRGRDRRQPGRLRVLLVRGAVDRAHDLDLLPGHRGCPRRLQEVLAVRRADHAARVRCCRPRQGGDRERHRWLDRCLVELVQPVRHRLVLDILPRPAPDDLHLLGLGQRSRRQRGDGESHSHARPRRLSSRPSCCSSPTRW